MTNPAPIATVEQLKKLQLLKKRKRLQKMCGLAFYKPHKKQTLFHEAGAKKRRYVRTGNRFGKSTLGASEDCAWAVGARLWLPEGDPNRTVGIPARSTKGVILVADWDKAKEIFTNDVEGEGMGKLFELLPRDRVVKKIKNNSGIISEIHIKSMYGGISTITLDTTKSFMSNSMGQESSDWDWIHVDEPIPKEMWTANARGLVDRNGSAWFTCTPLNQAWINDMFVPSRRTRVSIDKALEKDDNHWMITGSSYDNPHLTKEALQLFEAELTDEEKQCRISGIPLALSGLVYKEFDHEKHIYRNTPAGWEAKHLPPKGYTIRVSIDPHPRTPHAVLFAATAPTGETYIYSEIFRQELISGIAEGIHANTEGHWVHSYIMDPAGFIIHPVDNTSMADVFEREGVPVEKAPKDLQRGIMAVRAMLNKRHLSPSGEECCAIYFSDELTETIWEFDHYEWDAKKANKPVDKHDHMMECLYRLCINNLDFIPEETTDGFRPSPRTFGDTSSLPHYGDSTRITPHKKDRYGQ